RRDRRLGVERRQPYIVGKHERELAEDAIPRDAARHRGRERAETRALLARQLLLCGTRARGRGRQSRELTVQVVEVPLRGGHLAAPHHEERAEDGDDKKTGTAADEEREALLLDRALATVAGQKVDRTHG